MSYRLTSGGLKKAAMEPTCHQQRDILYLVWVTGWRWPSLSARLHFWMSVSLNRRLEVTLCLPCFMGQREAHKATWKAGWTLLSRRFTHTRRCHSATVKLHRARISLSGKVARCYFFNNEPKLGCDRIIFPSFSFLVIIVCPRSHLYGTNRNGIIFSSSSEH